ncbi:MAG TPA: chorismate mutase [Allosphingosinicella sp.]|nr:chorismate mutase [Allosphingosinicella sp.]
MPQAALAAPSAGPDLQSLRSQIDRIDAQLLDLMEERLCRAAAIAACKAGEDDSPLPLRPAREQQVIDRLTARARRMPAPAVAAIWRELMGANLQAQQQIHIVVHCPAQPVLVTDLARRHFGGAAPIIAAGTAEDALDGARHRAAIAVIEFSPLSRWWVQLFHDGQLAIFDCLRDRHGRIAALVVGRVAAAGDEAFLVLGDSALRRRIEAGEQLRTLAICGRLRLCVSTGAGARR